MIKKLLAVSMSALLILALGTSALASDTTVDTSDETSTFQMRQGRQTPQMGMNSDKMAELEALAEEAGLTLEEYMETIKPEMPEKKDAPDGAEMAERPQMDEMTREQPCEEMQAQREEKQAEMEEMKAEKEAELTAAAVEAGLTLEEYLETLTPEKGEGMGASHGMMQGGMMQGGMMQGGMMQGGMNHGGMNQGGARSK